MEQESVNSATDKPSGVTSQNITLPDLPTEFMTETLKYVWSDDDLRWFFNARQGSRAARIESIATLERKQHPHRWVSLISAREEVKQGQLSPILKAVYGQDKEVRKKALLALKELFVSTDSENSTVHWQKALILAAIEAAIQDPDQIHLVHTWLDCTRPHCPRRKIRFQRLLCDSLASCPPEAIPDLAGNVLNYLLRNKTENQESNLFFFFSAIAERAPLNFAKTYLQKHAKWLSVFCEKGAPLNEIIQNANSSSELQNSLLRLHLCKLYPSHRDVVRRARPYSDEEARNATNRLQSAYFETLEALLPLLAAGGLAKLHKNDEDRDRETSLSSAVSRGHLRIVQCLLNVGVAVNAQGYRGKTALIRAVDAARWRIEIARCLLAAGAAVNAQNDDGWTALFGVAYLGRLERVQFLLSVGALVGVQNKNGETALSLTTHSDTEHFDVAQCLLNAGAKADGIALVRADHKGHFRIVQSLLVAGAGVNAQNNKGWTALMCAAYNRHLQRVQRLLAARAAVNAQDNAGWTTLMMPESKGYTEIDALLKERAKEVKRADSHAVRNNANEALFSHPSQALLAAWGMARDDRKANVGSSSASSSSAQQPPLKQRRL